LQGAAHGDDSYRQQFDKKAARALMTSEGDLVTQLLRRAGQGKAMLPAPLDADAIVAFEAQSAVVKSLKAVLSARGVESPFIRSIADLAELCERYGAPLPRDLSGVEALTPYAPILRYDDVPSPAVDAQTALDWGASAVSWARDILESSQQPSG
jgi:HEPN domain-containing protein